MTSEVAIVKEYPKIMIENGIKFKVYKKSGKKHYYCEFENCESLAQNKTKYCIKHNNGILNDPKKHILTEEQKEKRKEKSNQNLIKSDKSESYIVKLLSDYPEIEEVKKIGQSQDRMDIIYKLKNELFFNL